MSERWNHITRNLLSLAIFPQQNVLEIHPGCCVYHYWLILLTVSFTFDLPLPVAVLTSEVNVTPLGQLGISSCYPQPPSHHWVSSLPDYSPVSLLPSTAKLLKNCLSPTPPSLSSPPTPSLHSNLASTPTSKSHCSCQEHLLVDNTHERFTVFI